MEWLKKLIEKIKAAKAEKKFTPNRVASELAMAVIFGLLISMMLGLPPFNKKEEVVVSTPVTVTPLNTFIAKLDDPTKLKSVTVVRPGDVGANYDEYSSPILVFYTLKDDKKTYKVSIPPNSFYRMEQELFWKKNIPYSFANKKFIIENKPQMTEMQESPYASGGGFFRTFLSLLPLILMGVIAWASLKSLKVFETRFKVSSPESIQGTMADLIGMDDIKAEVMQMEHMIREREMYESHGISKSFNIMLTGPAGTGKTKLAGFLAKSLNYPIIYISGSNLETGYVGGGSNTLKAISKKAEKLEKCIVFLDEAQALFLKRGQHRDSKYADDTPNTLLSILDGVDTVDRKNVIWIVASNFDDVNTEMDEAMLRRFPIKIAFRLPNLTEREHILKNYLEKKAEGCVDWTNVDLPKLADLFSNLAPAALEAIVDRASLLAIRANNVPITTDLLIKAFELHVVGNTDRTANADHDVRRRRVAVHEVGHLFARVIPMLEAGKSIAEAKEHARTLKISTEGITKLGALGYVLSSREDKHLMTLQDIEAEVMSLYGGVAAEELFYGKNNVSVGAADDIKKITNLLDLAVNKVSLYSDFKIDRTAFEGEGSNRIEALEAKAVELYHKTQKVLEAHKDLIDEIASELVSQYVMTGDEIFQKLETRLVPATSESV